MPDENQDLDSTTAQVDDQGTGDERTDAPTEDTSSVQNADATQGHEETFLQGDELDPRKLDQALQPIFKKMQAAYTKRMQAIAEIRDKAAVVDRFHSDPIFASQTLQQWAAQNGYQITPAQAQAAQRAASGNTPAYLVEAFKQNLQPELQWMAEPLAKAMGASMQGMLQPVLEQHQAQNQAQREQEWDKSAAELAQVAPGWEEHEDTMGELFDFFKSPAQVHPVYGSKLQMLYNLATANAASLKKAQERVAQAGKNRTSSSRSAGNRPSIEQDIAKASTQDAWKLAVQHALAQHSQKA